MADYKAKKLFFESNEFLSQPLQISLIKKDEFDEKRKGEHTPEFTMASICLKMKH